MECPNCGFADSGAVEKCRCGYDFPSKKIGGAYLAKKRHQKHYTFDDVIEFLVFTPRGWISASPLWLYLLASAYIAPQGVLVGWDINEITSDHKVTFFIMLPGFVILALIPAFIGYFDWRKKTRWKKIRDCCLFLLSCGLLTLMFYHTSKLFRYVEIKRNLEARAANFLPSIPTYAHEFDYVIKSPPITPLITNYPTPFYPVEVKNYSYQITLRFVDEDWPVTDDPKSARSIIIIDRRPVKLMTYTTGSVYQWKAVVRVLDAKSHQLLDTRCFEGSFAPGSAPPRVTYGGKSDSYSNDLWKDIKSYIRRAFPH